MKSIQLIQNKAQSFKTILLEKVESSNLLWIATAFVDRIGIDILRSILENPKNKNLQIKFVTGLLGRFMRKENLFELRALSKTYAGNIEIYISKNAKFHWKYYACGTSANAFSIFVGSSNFTDNGLSSSGEIMLWVEKVIKDIENDLLTFPFNDQLSDVINIKEFDIESYIERKITTETYEDEKVKRLLEEVNPSRKTQFHEKFCRLVKIQRYMSAKSIKIVQMRKSDWVTKGFDYYSFQSKSNWEALCRSKYMLNVYQESGTYYLELLLYKDRDEIATPGGKYYLANELVGKRKTITHTIEQEITRLGFNYKRRENNFRHTYLNKQQWQYIKSLFKL